MKIMNVLVLLMLSLLACKSDVDIVENTNTDTAEVEQGNPNDPTNNPIMGGPADIKMSFQDNTSSGTARIIGFYSDQNFVVDTVKFSGGKLHYQNDKGLPQGLYYFVFPTNEVVQVILADDQQMELEMRLSDVQNTIKVKDNKETEMFYQTARFESELIPRITALSDKMKTLPKEGADYAQLKKDKDALDAQRIKYIEDMYRSNPKSLFAHYKFGGQNPAIRENVAEDLQVFYYRKEFWDNIDFSDRRLLRTPMIGNKMKRYFKDLTPQHQDSIFSAAKLLMAKVDKHKEYFKVFANWVVLQYEPGKSTLMDSEAVFVNMVENYFTKEKNFWSDSMQVVAIQKRAYEMSASLIGKKAPNVISTDENGKQQDLLSKKADYLIVYMYNPECEHCMEQTPKLRDYWNKNKGKVDVFAIALDTDDTKWKDYIRKNNLTWTNVYDPTNRSIYAKYFVDKTPELYVINKDRVIIGKNLKVNQIDIIIDRDKEKKEK